MDDEIRLIAERAEQYLALELLVLYGSRARGDAHPGSDWDIGYLARHDFDPMALLVDLEDVLGTSKIDLLDLSRAGGLIRFRAARDGLCLFERTSGRFDEFRVAAVSFWLDVRHVVEPEYRALLQELG